MDLNTIINGSFAVCAFFAALWINGVRTELRELVKQVSNHGERIAVLESRVETLER